MDNINYIRSLLGLFAFLTIGILAVFVSFLMTNIIRSTIVAIAGFNYLWGINEIVEQEERVNKGWFPKNPKRK